MDLQKYPSQHLKTRTIKVEHFDLPLREFVQQMNKVMVLQRGAGLAANQVGGSVSLFIVDGQLARYPKGIPLVCINPKIETSGSLVKVDEGCLSFPGLELKIPRAEKCFLKAQGINGAFFEIEASGFLAQVFQHEHDHLVGKTMLDHLPRPERRRLRRLLKKA